LEIKGQISEKQLKLEKLSNDDYKKALSILEEDLSIESNPEKSIGIEEKIEELKKYQKTGNYPFGKESDKCRVSVYNSIKKAVEKIHKEFKARGDNDIIKLFNVGKSEIIKSGREFCYKEELISFDIQWQLDPK
jgi:hypothetical protein